MKGRETERVKKKERGKTERERKHRDTRKTRRDGRTQVKWDIRETREKRRDGGAI